MVNSEEFSNRLQKLFDYYDLNASAFADKIDVGRASISHLLSGRNKPSLDFVMRVVKNFPEVELYWLLNGKGEFPKTASQQKINKPTTLPKQEQPEKKKDLNPNLEHDSTNKKVDSSKVDSSSEIERIVIFFKNGSFKSFSPE